MTWEKIIPRKRRRQFQQFLAHENPRIRAVAERMRKLDAASRALERFNNGDGEPPSEEQYQILSGDDEEELDWMEYLELPESPDSSFRDVPF